MKPARRTAFSLLEVLLAMSILFGSLIVLGQLATIGREHALDAEDLTTAQLICQTKLNEILAGVTPARSVRKQPVEDALGWAYEVEVQSLDQPGLASLTVTVSEDVPEIQQSMEGRPIEQFTLTRWIRDPYRQGPASSGSDAPDLGSPPDSPEPFPFEQMFDGEAIP